MGREGFGLPFFLFFYFIDRRSQTPEDYTRGADRGRFTRPPAANSCIRNVKKCYNTRVFKINLGERKSWNKKQHTRFTSARHIITRKCQRFWKETSSRTRCITELEILILIQRPKNLLTRCAKEKELNFAIC